MHKTYGKDLYNSAIVLCSLSNNVWIKYIRKLRFICIRTWRKHYFKTVWMYFRCYPYTSIMHENDDVSSWFWRIRRGPPPPNTFKIHQSYFKRRLIPLTFFFRSFWRLFLHSLEFHSLAPTWKILYPLLCMMWPEYRFCVTKVMKRCVSDGEHVVYHSLSYGFLER